MTFTIDRTSWRSPNHHERTERIESIVVHSCEGVWPTPRSSSLPWLCKPGSAAHDPVSCHYYVCRNTEIFQLVDDDEVAYHSGVSLARFDNGSSIGVECEHRNGQNWPAEQKAALAWLLRRLMREHQIPLVAIETHGQIAIKGPYKRKTDPTNWPHDEFVAWRNQQLGGDPFARWGSVGKPSGGAVNFAIPKAWLVNQRLGACVVPEQTSSSQKYAIAEFEHGIITYYIARKAAIVELF